MKGNLDGLRPQYRSMLRNFWKGSGPLNKLINDLLSALWRNYSRGFAFKNKILNLNEVPIKKECA
jgi:hypothetical protein